ncbi:MAG: orotidine-5'-phosphate decarboxylase [Pyrinomonadaceae bacterium]
MSREKIIVALDVESANEARAIMSELGGEVGAFKIGLQLFTAAGARFVREAVESGNKIFLDLKFHDIPNTVAGASVEAARLGAWMFNVHAVGGGEMMRRAVEEVGEICAKENLTLPKIIAVTVLTSSNNETLREVGVESGTEAQVLKLAKLARQCNLHGVVASPREIKLIRAEIADKDFLIVTPGIRNLKSQFPNLKSQKSDDQKRITSAAEALREGADYLVIGRPILKSDNPRLAVREILDEIANQIETPAAAE